MDVEAKRLAHNEYQKKWAKLHPYNNRKTSATWRAKNPRYDAEQAKIYRLKYPEKSREYYLSNIHKWKSDGRKTVSLKWREDNKGLLKMKRISKKLIWYKLIKELGMDKCEVCGYDFCFAAIEFHHVNPDEKKKPISAVFKSNISESGIDELLKCVSLCANCHREYHFHETGFEVLRRD
jgi:hypothetical protein